MKNQTPFSVSAQTVWALVLVNLALSILGLAAYFMQWYAPNYAITLGGIVFFSAWLIIGQDMLQQKIYNKAFWLASLFILPSLSLLIYLIQRPRLLRLAKRFGTF